VTGAFYLKCMGLPELRAPDGRVVRMRGRKHLALLAYLAVERRTQYARDELAHLLWADTPMLEARHSLATGISAIRRVLGSDVLEGNREVVRFRHHAVMLDVERLETGDLFATPTLPAIEVEGFLRGFEVRDAQEYMIWRDRQHARWLPAIHGALLRLIDHSRRTGASRMIGNLADRLLAIDPLSEVGIRAKMEGLAFAGDRISALRVFEEWRNELGTQLMAVPSPLVEGMARRLRRRGVDRAGSDPVPAVQTDPWRDRPFVGRAAEYRTLYEAWERTTRHDPRHLLVIGESGIGKSTLVERFAMAAALEGAVVARVQCYALEQAIPFAAIAALVGGLIDKPGVAATDPTALAEVARVVPRVRDRFPGLPTAMDSQGETARLHFAEGLLAMLQAAMEEHPVILVIDDFHMADEVSLTVLHLLMRRLDTHQMMVLFTTRSSELPSASGAARIRDGGDYLRLHLVPLPPLTEAESSELLAALVPRDAEPPTPSERQVLLQAARGVPMVLQLLVHDWHQRGSASLALSARSMAEQSGGMTVSEGAYQHIMERVLGDLDPVTRLVLHAATVLGSRLHDLSLYLVADLTPAQTMMGMAELARRHILRDSPSGLDFVNELVRGQAYAGMPLALRRGLHGAFAEELLARLASGREHVRGLETAWHLVRGNRAKDAAPHLLRGAREAIREGAPHEAELALGSALTGEAVLTGESRTEAILLHAEVLQELSMWTQSLVALTTLPANITETQVQEAVLLETIATHRLGRYDEFIVQAKVEALLALGLNCSLPRVRARAVCVAAMIVEERQLSHHREKVWHAIDSISLLPTQLEERADVLMARATLNYDVGCAADSVSNLLLAIELLEGAKITNAAYGNLISGLSALYCALGDYPTSENYGHLAYKLALRLDNAYLVQKASANLSVALGRQGKYKDQESWGRISLAPLNRRDHHNGYIRAALCVGEARAMLNERDAPTVYREILAQAGELTSEWTRQAAILNEADIHLLVGNKKRALELGAEGTTGRYSTIHSRGWTGKFVRWLTLTARAQGSPESAMSALAPILRDLRSFDALDRIEIAGCYLLLSGGQTEEGERLAEEASCLLAQMPSAVADRLERLGVLPPRQTYRHATNTVGWKKRGEP